MGKNYFNKDLGGYTIENAPLIGEYEYYYANPDVLMKVDQYGLNMIQAAPPADIAIIKRERGNNISPWKVWFLYNGKMYHNFDFIMADAHTIMFNPTCAIYELTFGTLKVSTKIMVPKRGCRAIMRTTFTNLSTENVTLRVMPYLAVYANDLMMAPWDKPEWYTKTFVQQTENILFTTNRYSTSGNEQQRRYVYCWMDGQANACDISAERIFAQTRGFTELQSLNDVKEEENGLFAFPQAYAAMYNFELSQSAQKTFTQILGMSYGINALEAEIQNSRKYFAEEELVKEQAALKEFYQNMFSVNRIETKDEDFNAFVNAFLPLELFWVSKLDRGWPTGMRGVRDCANDFMGMLSYDAKECRKVLLRLLECQRGDGWYPRQIPVKDGKFDLRPFMDGGNFVMEFVYHYLAYTHDFSVLEEVLPYYDNETRETAYVHLIKGMDFYLREDNIGEHGLCKIYGGDWLDTLSGAGLLGRGESVMITCQLIMSLEYISKISLRVPEQYRISEEKRLGYLERVEQFKKNINMYALNQEGFYRGVFTDNGEWLFSEKDPDGECRPYVPTNAYAIISGVCDNATSIIEHLKSLKCNHGYRLFYPTMGKKRVELIGKMGTGDLLAGFSENGNPYNHGSHGFFLRALAKSKDASTFYDVLNYMMPQNAKYHNPQDSRSAPYAIINVYHSIPMYMGRAGFSFLTGSVAMLYRAIYHWMAGVEFTFDGIEISPCIPVEFSDMSIVLKMRNGKALKIRYCGSGTEIVNASVGKILEKRLVILEAELEKVDEVVATVK